LPHAHVLVGSLFSVTALSQAAISLERGDQIECMEGKRTALEGRLLAAGAGSFLCTNALGAVVTSAASHVDGDGWEELNA
jgi:hypothetical protein